jgi:prepilin-type N-terminal cleavage/methylation domain-containing protein
MTRSTNTAARRKSNVNRGFSLIELVIVVVIIGIIAAIAIPRMSRGTAGAGDSALGGNLSVLRSAIELYASEHGGVFPGNKTGVTAEDQLTKYSKDDGSVSDTKDATNGYVYGPYLRKIPPITVGPVKSDNTKNTKFIAGTTIETTPTGAWLYDKASGTIKANVPTDVDQNNKLYSDY